jgi:hypothetical protein
MYSHLLLFAHDIWAVLPGRSLYAAHSFTSYPCPSPPMFCAHDSPSPGVQQTGSFLQVSVHLSTAMLSSQLNSQSSFVRTSKQMNGV